MRIPSLMAVLVVGFSLVGCGGVQPVSVEEQDTAPAVAEQHGAEGPTAQGVCPALWTCDYGSYYSTKAECTAACGGNACYRDYVCNDRCACP